MSKLGKTNINWIYSALITFTVVLKGYIFTLALYIHVMLVRVNRNYKRVAWQGQWTSLKRF